MQWLKVSYWKVQQNRKFVGVLLQLPPLKSQCLYTDQSNNSCEKFLNKHKQERSAISMALAVIGPLAISHGILLLVAVSKQQVQPGRSVCHFIYTKSTKPITYLIDLDLPVVNLSTRMTDVSKLNTKPITSKRTFHSRLVNEQTTRSCMMRWIGHPSSSV